MSLTPVVFSASGLFTPPFSISNDELVKTFNQYVDQYNQQHAQDIEAGQITALAKSDAAFIEKASGIKSRFVMDREGILDPVRMCPNLPERADEEISLQAQMGLKAAQDALDKRGLSGSDIDMILLACSNMQRAYPAVSVEIQAALNAQGFAFDMNVACSSATFALETAYNAIAAGSVKRALIINAEICSAHLNFCDRDSHFIFGDAASAMILEREDLLDNPSRGFTIVGTSLFTQFSNNIRNNFGFLNRCDKENQFNRDKLFAQQGRKVFKEVSPAVSEHITHHLQSLNLSANQIKRFWLHQANQNMNQLIARKVLGRDASLEEAPIILDRYANTSSAGSIIAFHLYHDDFQKNELGLICSFGAGYSIGSVVVEKR